MERQLPIYIMYKSEYLYTVKTGKNKIFLLSCYPKKSEVLTFGYSLGNLPQDQTIITQ